MNPPLEVVPPSRTQCEYILACMSGLSLFEVRCALAAKFSPDELNDISRFRHEPFSFEVE